MSTQLSDDVAQTLIKWVRERTGDFKVATLTALSTNENDGILEVQKDDLSKWTIRNLPNTILLPDIAHGKDLVLIPGQVYTLRGLTK